MENSLLSFSAPLVLAMADKGNHFMEFDTGTGDLKDQSWVPDLPVSFNSANGAGAVLLNQVFLICSGSVFIEACMFANLKDEAISWQSGPNLMKKRQKSVSVPFGTQLWILGGTDEFGMIDGQ